MIERVDFSDLGVREPYFRFTAEDASETLVDFARPRELFFFDGRLHDSLHPQRRSPISGRLEDDRAPVQVRATLFDVLATEGCPPCLERLRNSSDVFTAIYQIRVKRGFTKATRALLEATKMVTEVEEYHEAEDWILDLGAQGRSHIETVRRLGHAHLRDNLEELLEVSTTVRKHREELVRIGGHELVLRALGSTGWRHPLTMDELARSCKTAYEHTAYEHLRTLHEARLTRMGPISGPGQGRILVTSRIKDPTEALENCAHALVGSEGLRHALVENHSMVAGALVVPTPFRDAFGDHSRVELGSLGSMRVTPPGSRAVEMIELDDGDDEHIIETAVTFFRDSMSLEAALAAARAI